MCYQSFVGLKEANQAEVSPNDAATIVPFGSVSKANFRSRNRDSYLFLHDKDNPLLSYSMYLARTL